MGPPGLVALFLATPRALCLEHAPRGLDLTTRQCALRGETEFQSAFIPMVTKIVSTNIYSMDFDPSKTLASKEPNLSYLLHEISQVELNKNYQIRISEHCF